MLGPVGRTGRIGRALECVVEVLHAARVPAKGIIAVVDILDDHPPHLALEINRDPYGVIRWRGTGRYLARWDQPPLP